MTRSMSQSRRANIERALPTLASLERRDGAYFGQIGENRAPGDARENTFADGCDLSIIDELVELLRRNAEGPHGFIKAKLHICRHDASIIAQVDSVWSQPDKRKAMPVEWARCG
jgi:hypothetical protein